MFLSVWFTGVPSSMGAIAVFALNHDFLAIRREIKNGSFSPWSYIVSNALFQARPPRPRARPPPAFRRGPTALCVFRCTVLVTVTVPARALPCPGLCRAATPGSRR